MVWRVRLLQILLLCMPVLLVYMVHMSGQFDERGVFADSIPLSTRGLFSRWRRIDLSDPSWRQFRNDMIRLSPLFLSSAVFHQLVSFLYCLTYPLASDSPLLLMHSDLNCCSLSSQQYEMLLGDECCKNSGLFMETLPHFFALCLVVIDVIVRIYGILNL